MEIKNEIWKNIPNYEGIYQASTFGRIKSLDRIQTNVSGISRKLKGKILSQGKDNKGYKIVRLSCENINTSFRVHQLIAITFLNHKPINRKIVVDHIDNIKTNNYLYNIQVISNRDNSSKDNINSLKNTGVYKAKKEGFFYSQIRINDKRITLGHFNDIDSAKKAYEKAKENIHLYNNGNSEFRKLINEMQTL